MPIDLVDGYLGRAVDVYMSVSIEQHVDLKTGPDT